jgi:hypothetical protein
MSSSAMGSSSAGPTRGTGAATRSTSRGRGRRSSPRERKVAQLTADRLLAALSEEEMGVLHDLLARIAAGEENGRAEAAA